MFDAIVIGGGPAGAASAIGLARQGRRVALLEKAAFPRRKVCGEFLSATSVPVLERLGVADAWHERAGPEVRKLALFAEARVIEARDAGAGGVWPGAWPRRAGRAAAGRGTPPGGGRAPAGPRRGAAARGRRAGGRNRRGP